MSDLKMQEIISEFLDMWYPDDDGCIMLDTAYSLFKEFYGDKVTHNEYLKSPPNRAYFKRYVELSIDQPYGRGPMAGWWGVGIKKP